MKKKNSSLFKNITTFIVLFTIWGPLFSQSKYQQIDSLVNAVIKADGPGAQVIVIRKDTILFNKGYGYADIVTKEPINENSLFYLASLSKQFTAFAIQILQEKKKLNYNDPVKKYIPAINDKYSAVTIHQLLSHTSGIADYYKLTNDYRALTNKKVLEILDTSAVVLNTSGKFAYSNSNYILLAEIIESVSRMSFGAFL